MAREPGLRERKKQQTRELIAETARRLFSEHGFDGVTVAEIAREADVAVQTVFNYFPTKEDLFYFRMESFEARLLDAVRDRERGETVLAAFRRFLLAPRGVFAQLAAGDSREAGERLRTITRVITSSPALLAREHQVFERYTAALAELIARETDARANAVEPWVVAHALMGVHRALIDLVRRETLAGADIEDITRAVRAEGKHALALLERGLDGYAARP
jgi:AcrR family transcriptional regulator